MADARTREPTRDRVSSSRDDHPRVLVVLVVRDGAKWLARCLRSLARQTHPRLGVVAVDNGSTDGSGERLVEALGERRVLRVERNIGFTDAVSRALEVPAADRADYFLLVHDDSVLAPTAVERMVECASRIRGTGVVGPKVLDGERPRVLREVGLATDRFGYPHSPLEEDELDQGQYDSIREVLFVSTAAMLVSRDAWLRAGALDERLVTTHSDLDFCWRVRLAGYRVVVDPRAVVHHFAVGERGLRAGSRAGRARYLAERAGLLSLLKNYRLGSLFWILPIYVAQGVVKIAVFLAGRRFSTAGQILAAWGWNIVHLPGTIRRRVRGHAVRTAKDRDVLRFMAPAGERGRRLVQEASALLFGGTESVEDPAERRAVGERVSSFVLAHPVALGWTAAIALTLIAFRDVLFGPLPAGGALPVFPRRAGELFGAFLQPWHDSAFGTAAPASPALVPLGLASFLTLGNPRLLMRLLVAAGPLVAGVVCYRAALRLTSMRIAAVAAAACYAASAVVLWAASEGRIGAVVYLMALPWLAVRVLEGFAEAPRRWGPWALGTGAILAITASFFPSAWMGFALFLAASLLTTPARAILRGAGLAFVGAAAAVALILPFAMRIVIAGGPGASDAAGAARWADLARLAPG
ncbi:MAG TPA: glycosyltransferase family 2 protein, partial [Actinomycetota bacterium]|nr:glycosyltransferase family 2 protein [Actinomycetota bacterium]